MKTKLLFVLAISLAVSGLAIGGSVTDSLSVSGNITATCHIISVTAVDFGNLSSSGSVAQGDVTVNCDGDTAYNIALGAGQNFDTEGCSGRRIMNGGSGICYVLWKDPERTQKWGDGFELIGSPVSDTATGSPQPHVVYGSTGSYGGFPPPGAYNDTVVVTVNF